LKVLHRSMVYIETATGQNRHLSRRLHGPINAVFYGHFVAPEETEIQSADVLLY
jgi:hypothetical protein